MRPKGSIKTQGSGRKKGTPNKRTQSLIERIKACGKDPFDVLSEFLNHADDSIRFAAAKELMQYEYPKRKAVELNAHGFFRREVERVDGSVDAYTNEPDGEE